jgi:hypothetical protein
MRPGMRAFPRRIFTLFFFFTAALIVADETTLNLASVVLDGFDQPDKSLWIVQGSKFATPDYPQTIYVKTWPDALFGKNKDNKDLYAIGIHGKFDRKAYNYIEIIPAKKGTDGKLAPNPIQIPGRLKSIDLWVWGSNYNFYMDVHLRDFQGVDHTLRLGDLTYAGWKNLFADIPGSIPQSRKYIPRFQGLELTEFVIWTRPDERVDDFYIFLDQVKVLTDMFESRFDGDNLADLDTLNQLWSSGVQATK